jgi:hypothetical protein
MSMYVYAQLNSTSSLTHTVVFNLFTHTDTFSQFRNLFVVMQTLETVGWCAVLPRMRFVYVFFAAWLISPLNCVPIAHNMYVSVISHNIYLHTMRKRYVPKSLRPHVYIRTTTYVRLPISHMVFSVAIVENQWYSGCRYRQSFFRFARLSFFTVRFDRSNS